MAILSKRSSMMYVVLFLVLAVVVSVATYLLVRTFGGRYQGNQASTNVRQVGTLDQSFAIQKIVVVDNKTGRRIEILRNGTTLVEDGNQQLLGRDILSNEVLLRLFGKLDKEQFESLLQNYYSGTLDLTLYFETNHGNKTVVVNDQGTEPISPDLEEIIEDIEDIEEEVTNPTNTPLPTLPPTPIPSLPPGSTPTPAPSGTPQPTSTPLPPGVTPEPFNCTMVENGVTVSNIRCLDGSIEEN